MVSISGKEGDHVTARFLNSHLREYSSKASNSTSDPQPTSSCNSWAGSDSTDLGTTSVPTRTCSVTPLRSSNE